MSKEKFDKFKTKESKGKVLHASHGKTTLTSEIAKVLSEKMGGTSKKK